MTKTPFVEPWSSMMAPNELVMMLACLREHRLGRRLESSHRPLAFRSAERPTARRLFSARFMNRGMSSEGSLPAVLRRRNILGRRSGRNRLRGSLVELAVANSHGIE